MLSIEVIGVLGGLFGLLVYGMLRTQLVRRKTEARHKAQKGAPVTAEEAR